jgi:hypothetical protein
MLRPIIEITIEQQPTTNLPSRNKTYVFNFSHDVNISSSWSNLTDTCKITLPKNITIKDINGNKYSLKDSNRFIVGRNETNQNAFVLRGDKIKVVAGYIWKDKRGSEQQMRNEIFKGYITKVVPKTPFEIECEDEMWILKQTYAVNKTYVGKNVNEILTDMITLAKLPYQVNTANSNEDYGTLRIENMTIAQVLELMRKEYKIESYFRNDELRASPLVYYPNDNIIPPVVFKFQKNIITDNLEYTRTDDVKIGIKAYSVSKEELKTTTFDGVNKRRKKRIEIFVTKDEQGKVVVQDLSSSISSTINNGTYGDVVSLYFNVETKEELTKIATAKLNKLYYEGYHGKFTTFGLPFVKHGYQVKLEDNKLPERNGTYFVKSVNYTFNDGGYRQEIELHYRVDGILTIDDLSKGL